MSKLKELFEWIKGKGIEVSASDAIDLAAMTNDNGALPTGTPPLPNYSPEDFNHNRKVIAELKDVNDTLTKQIAALQADYKKQIDDMQTKIDGILTATAEKDKANQEAINILKQEQEDKAKREKDAQIQTLIDEAIRSGKIPPENEDLKAKYTELAQANFDATKLTLDALSAKTENKDTIITGGANLGGSATPYAKDMSIENYAKDIVIK